MKNRKNMVNEEPLWKKRRKEEQLAARKSRLWIVLIVILMAVVLAFMIYALMRGLRPSKVKETAVSKHTISQIVDKVTVQQNGKTERYIVFRVIGKTMRKSVDQKTFDSLEKGKEVLLTYDEDYMGCPKAILGWSPIKFAKPVEAGKK